MTKPVRVEPPKKATSDQIQCIKALAELELDSGFEYDFMRSMMKKVNSDFEVYLTTRQAKALNQIIEKYRDLSLLT